MSHKRKGEVKERNNKMQLYSFNKPIIPARTKIPRQAVHIISFDKAIKTHSKPQRALQRHKLANRWCLKKKGNQNVANPSDSPHFLGVITNYISIIMVMLGNLQQRISSNYSVIFYISVLGAILGCGIAFDCDTCLGSPKCRHKYDRDGGNGT